jgi:hypothetical protein
MSDQDSETDIFAETDNYVVIRSEDAVEGYYYHVILGGVTLNLTSEEWNELVLLIRSADA